MPAKLVLPAAGPGLVWRDDLVDRLARAHDRSAVVLTAPAGYGKTTLIGQWAAADPRPFTYLRLDPADNDPGRLLGYLAQAVDTVEPLPAEQLGGLTAFAAREAYDPTIAIARLGAAIIGLRTPFVLVIDDAHHLTATASRALLETVLDHLPSRSQLAVAGRSESPLPIGRLRGTGRVLLLAPDDLAMRPDDTAALFASSGMAVDEAATHRLTTRTGGWPVVVRLAVAACVDRADQVPRVVGVAGASDIPSGAVDNTSEVPPSVVDASALEGV
ncbi:MAG: AAA family ATPase, partial [Frankia sp.]